MAVPQLSRTEGIIRLQQFCAVEYHCDGGRTSSASRSSRENRDSTFKSFSLSFLVYRTGFFILYVICMMMLGH